MILFLESYVTSIKYTCEKLNLQIGTAEMINVNRTDSNKGIFLKPLRSLPV